LYCMELFLDYINNMSCRILYKLHHLVFWRNFTLLYVHTNITTWNLANYISSPNQTQISPAHLMTKTCHLSSLLIILSPYTTDPPLIFFVSLFLATNTSDVFWFHL
jgi:hypothetical protein